MYVQAYVTQLDVLMTTLTVREAVLYSAQLQLPSSMHVVGGEARPRGGDSAGDGAGGCVSP
jgi:ABC-type multidrug transport system ATPase subunit